MSESSGAPIDLVLLWHHHQPDYRDPDGGRSVLPWVRLHATKDYLDMAERLDRHAGVKMTFNLVPVLVDQILDAERGGSDALFDLLAEPVASLSEESRRELLWRCAMFPPYARDRWPAVLSVLRRVAGTSREALDVEGFADQEILTLKCGFLLAWLDPMYQHDSEAAAAVAAMGSLGESHCRALMELHARLLSRVLPVYRGLEERGQVELSTSPYCHPILPLLVSTESAQRARPDLRLPSPPFEASADASAQILRALEHHETIFGRRPDGMWPSEGSVSPEVVALAAGKGVRWLATDEEVLWRSIGKRERRDLYRPWRVRTADGDVTLFFRDHDLSDRIGFVYRTMGAQEAVNDFVGRLRQIGRDHAQPDGRAVTVSVILDGENCWEHYADDGDPFLETLYRTLADAGDIRTRTPSEVLADHGEPAEITNLHTGSWIDADFHIWIGHAEKNRAWELLRDVRARLVAAGTTVETHPAAWHSLHAAEGSDWFWWFGDDHQTLDSGLFDHLCRAHLRAACEHAGLSVPAELRHPIVAARVHREAGTPLGFVHPVVDGRVTTYYEWTGAGCHDFAAGGDAMHRTAGLTQMLYHGYDAERLALRLDFEKGLPGDDVDLVLEFHAPIESRLRVRRLGHGPCAVEWEASEGREAGGSVEGAAAFADDVLEVVIPFTALGVEAGQSAIMVGRLVRDGVTMETVPPSEALRFDAPDRDFEHRMWWV